MCSCSLSSLSPLLPGILCIIQCKNVSNCLVLGLKFHYVKQAQVSGLCTITGKTKGKVKRWGATKSEMSRRLVDQPSIKQASESDRKLACSKRLFKVRSLTSLFHYFFFLAFHFVALLDASVLQMWSYEFRVSYLNMSVF